VTSSPTAAIPPWTVALGAIFSVQLSAALSVHLIAIVGAAGTAWLRLTAGALIFLALARPPLREIRRRDLPGLLALGVTSGLMGVAILGAIERIPLGTAVAIGFLGPLTVAAVRSHSRAALVWPALALAGVALLTEPWIGAINGVGVAYAVATAICWGTYILLTQRVGDRFTGIKGLTVTVPIAAVTTAFVGIPQASGHLTPTVIAAAVGLALLFPVVTFALEMAALRRMTHTAFGTLMALEPAVGVVLGLLVLHQKPSVLQIAGILLVVLAGAAAQYRGRRRGSTEVPDSEDSPTTAIPPA
jgi:inner membrane transporter RhtA